MWEGLSGVGFDAIVRARICCCNHEGSYLMLLWVLWSFCLFFMSTEHVHHVVSEWVQKILYILLPRYLSLYVRQADNKLTRVYCLKHRSKRLVSPLLSIEYLNLSNFDMIPKIISHYYCLNNKADIYFKLCLLLQIYL